jgi:hypothetical protein
MRTRPVVGPVFLLLLSACTPRVILQGPPSQFCPCMSLPLTYEVDGADSATWIIDPPSATQPGTEPPSLRTPLSALRNGLGFEEGRATPPHSVRFRR